MVSYQYFYLCLGIFLVPLWLVLFLLRKDLRHKMLVMSCIIGLLGPLSELWYIQDYWRPGTLFGFPLGIEDLIYPFLIGGISCVLYEEIFRKHVSAKPNKKYNWHFLLLLLVSVSFIVLNYFFFILGINSIYASVIAYAFLGIGMLFLRRDLLLDAMLSGILLGLVMVGEYILLLGIFPDMFTKIWLLHNTSRIFVGKIPVEELVWGFGWGFVAGPIYEFYTGLRLAKR